MSLAPFREAVLADAREDAARRRFRAEVEARRRVERARAEAERLEAEARAQGRDDAERATPEALQRARRAARERVLATHREVAEELHRRAVSALAALPERERAELDDALAALGRERLGDDAEVHRDGTHGGVVVETEERRLDLRFSALVALAVADVGAAVEELWR